MPKADGNLPHSGDFVGRKSEIALLRALLEQAGSGRGVTVLVSGPAGIGKTSLLRWLQEESRSRRFKTRWGYCLPGIDEPFFPFQQVFRGGGHARAHSATAELEDAGNPLPLPAPFLVRPGSKGLASDLPLLGASGPSRAGIHRTSGDRPRVAGEVLLDYLSTLETDTRAGPQALLLDDFHWADAESVRALKFLARNVRDLPVLLAVALREDELEDPEFRQTLRDIRRENLSRDLPLPGFREPEAQQLLQGVIHAPLDTARLRAALRALLDRTGGNPYFLLETAHELQDSGQIRSEGGRAVLSLRPPLESRGVGVPRSVADLLKKRLDQLSSQERDLLESAALLGEEFDAVLLTDAMGFSPDVAKALLSPLSEEKGLLRSDPLGRSRYSFAHALLWQTVVDSVTPERYRVISVRLAEWWERHLPADAERISALYFGAGEPRKAIPWTDRALELAFQIHAHERVVKHLGRGLDAREQGGVPRTESLRWALAILDRLASDGADGKWTVPVCRKLLEMDPPPPLSWEIDAHLILATATHIRQARPLLGKLEKELEAHPDVPSEVLGKVGTLEAVLSDYEGHDDKVVAFARKALGLLPAESTFYRGLAYYRLGYVAIDQNDWEEAMKALESGLACAKAGQHWGLMPMLLNLQGSITSSLGDQTRAEELYAEAVDLSRGLGRESWISIMGSNLALIKGWRGDLVAAERLGQEALRVAESFGLRWEAAVAMEELGHVRLLRGDPEGALKILERGQRQLAGHGNARDIVPLLLRIAEAKGACGDTALALRSLDGIERKCSLKQDETINLLVLRARLRMRMGERAVSGREIEEALKEARANKLRYTEAHVLLAKSEWERRFGKAEEAKAILNRAEVILRDCGVVNVTVFTSPILQDASRPVAELTEGRGPGRLTLRLLQHLAKQGGHVEAFGKEDIVPMSLTQQGIAQALGIPRDRFNVVLRRLERKGLVSVSTRLVRGSTRQLKVYLLTRAGSAAIGPP